MYKEILISKRLWELAENKAKNPKQKQGQT